MTRNLLHRFALALTTSVALTGSALAADYWAESSPVPSRADATALRNALDLDALSRLLHDGGISARVVRRLVDGEGWRFVLRVDGLVDEAAGLAAAQAIAGTGVSAAAWMREGDAVLVLDSVQATTAEGAGTQVGATANATLDGGVERDGLASTAELPTARQVLKRAEKAHGGNHDALERVRLASSLRFAYTRDAVLADGHLRARNVYRRSGDALRLDVDVVEGDGVDSTTILTANNHAFVVVDDDAQPRDPTRTREVLARFGPELVLAIPLGFTRDVRQAAAWQDLDVVGSVDLPSGRAWKLAPAGAGAATDGLVSACFDQVTDRLVRVEWQGRAGLMRFDFDDYRPVGDELTVPYAITIWRDAVAVEVVSIDELALEVPIDTGLFSSP